MKKLFFLVMLSAVTTIAAQAQIKNIKYGIRVGGGLASQSYDNSSVKSTDYIRVFNAGFVFEIPIYKEYYLKPYLGINNKGVTIFEDALTTTNKITYINLTLDAVRKYNASGLGKLVFGLGPYVAEGWKGSLEYETPSSDNEDKVAFGEQSDFRRLDAGLNAMAGLELNNRLTFSLTYDWGLTNIASQALKDVGYKSIYNRLISINLGYSFK